MLGTNLLVSIHAEIHLVTRTGFSGAAVSDSKSRITPSLIKEQPFDWPL